MSKRWIVRCLAGIAGTAILIQPAFADGWLRSRLRSLCETPSAPWSAPNAAPAAAPSVTPAPSGVDAPKVQPPVGGVPGDMTPMPPVPEPAAEPRFEPLISAALGEAGLAVAFQPAMFGDLTGRGFSASIITRVGPFAPAAPLVPGQTVPGRPVPPGPPQPQPQQRVILQFPQLSYGSFKIAENESPRPVDRVFVTYNYYNNLPTSSFTPGFDVHRETVGFEKTLMDGRASVGVRVPFQQLSGADQVLNAFNIPDGQFGDVSVITKYAFYDDRATGNLLSGGLMVTAPTGTDNYVVNGNRIHSTLLQPWGGMIWSLSDSVFVHGFSSVVFPTDSADVTAWYNDLGLGYWLRRGEFDRFFHGIVPTAEVHVGTPLNNRGYTLNQVHVPDYVSLVGGVNFVFGKNSTLGFAAGAPVTGPRPWDFETHVSINFRF
jgi:hypothetical protein